MNLFNFSSFRRLLFPSPQPPHYSPTEHKNVLVEIPFPEPKVLKKYYPNAEFPNYKRIPCFYFPPNVVQFSDESSPDPKKNQNFLKSADYASEYPMIVYCHGNGCDLGSLEQVFSEFRRHLKCQFLAVEYPGYGPLDGVGEPNQSNINAHLFISILYLIQVLKFPIQKIILFGTSIGTGAVCHMVNLFAQNPELFLENNHQDNPLLNTINKNSSSSSSFSSLFSSIFSPSSPSSSSSAAAISVSPPPAAVEPTATVTAAVDSGSVSASASVPSSAPAAAVVAPVSVPLPCFAGLILQSPYTTVRDIISHLINSSFIAALIGKYWNSLSEVAQFPTQMPVLILHGSVDTLIPPLQSIRLYNAISPLNHSKHLLIIPNVDHNSFHLARDLILPIRYFMNFYEMSEKTADRSSVRPNPLELDQVLRQIHHTDVKIDDAELARQAGSPSSDSLSARQHRVITEADFDIPVSPTTSGTLWESIKTSVSLLAPSLRKDNSNSA